MEWVKVIPTRRTNAAHRELRRPCKGSFFHRALRIVKECQETVEQIRFNPLRRELLRQREDWGVAEC
jgi:hypothetical protein